jgi:hypothetical protein
MEIGLICSSLNSHCSSNPGQNPVILIFDFQKSRSDLLGQLETQLSELVDDILTDVDDIEQKPTEPVSDHTNRKR